MRYLLDKGVVRRLVEALANSARGSRLTPEQQQVAALLQLTPEQMLFLSEETWNLLTSRGIPRYIIEVIDARMECLVPLRYQRRWARRLRQTFMFEREDAHLLALATFGGDAQGRLLGVNGLLTFDVRLINRFHIHLSQIEIKLCRMTSHLDFAYSQAALPELMAPGAVVPASSE